MAWIVDPELEKRMDEIAADFADQLLLADNLVFKSEQKLMKKGVGFLAYYVTLVNCCKSARATISEKDATLLPKLDALAESIWVEIQKLKTNKKSRGT